MSDVDAIATALPFVDDLERGTLLFREGDPVSDVFWVSGGLIKLVATEPGGERIVGCRGAGHLLGGAGAVLSHPHRSTAIAAQRTTVRRLCASEFCRLTTSDVRFVSVSLEAIRAEVSSTIDDSLRARHATLERRVTMLLDLVRSREEPDADYVSIPSGVTAEDLASLLQLTPAELARALKVWQRAGFVRRTGDGLVFRRSAFEDPEGAGAGQPDAISVTAAERASSDGLVERVIAFVRDHYTDPDLSLAQVSQHVNRSMCHVSRAFNSATGLHFRQCLSRVRGERGRELLERTPQLVKEIAAAVGYKHAGDFTRDFSAIFGMGPSAYRLMYRNAQRHLATDVATDGLDL